MWPYGWAVHIGRVLQVNVEVGEVQKELGDKEDRDTSERQSSLLY